MATALESLSAEDRDRLEAFLAEPPTHPEVQAALERATESGIINADALAMARVVQNHVQATLEREEALEAVGAKAQAVAEKSVHTGDTLDRMDANLETMVEHETRRAAMAHALAESMDHWERKDTDPDETSDTEPQEPYVPPAPPPNPWAKHAAQLVEARKGAPSYAVTGPAEGASRPLDVAVVHAAWHAPLVADLVLGLQAEMHRVADEAKVGPLTFTAISAQSVAQLPLKVRRVLAGAYDEGPQVSAYAAVVVVGLLVAGDGQPTSELVPLQRTSHGDDELMLQVHAGVSAAESARNACNAALAQMQAAFGIPLISAVLAARNVDDARAAVHQVRVKRLAEETLFAMLDK